MNYLGSIVALLISAVSVAAQPVVVPQVELDGDAPSVGPVAGFCANHRQQILIDARHMTALAGKQLRGLWLRRDGFFSDALAAADADLTISMSETQVRSDSPSESFARNRGASVVQVFQGRVSLPSSPALPDNTVGWAPPNAINIRFVTPFTYSGTANLCIEIDGASVGSGPCFRPFDYAFEGRVGTVSKYGQACGKYAGRYRLSASASAANMRIASSASFYAWAQPGTPGVMMIGDNKYDPGIDLGPIGAVGCELYLNPAISIGASFDQPTRSGEPGTAKVGLKIPLATTLMGSMMWVQWVDVEVGLPRQAWSNPLGITTSNGLEITISSLPPGLGMSTVLSDIARNGNFPSHGRVNVSKAPAMRFDT